MPEGPEIDTDKLRETIDEEIEREGGALLRTIALSTALFAALAAIASMEAGGTINEALLLKTAATRLQAQASDQWAYYQAKGIKAAIAHDAQGPWLAGKLAPPPELASKEARYLNEQKAISDKARELEKQRDDQSAEAERLIQRHHGFSEAVALLQVGIALGAVAALTRARLVWWGSLLLGLAGGGLFGWGLLAG
ncbi:MAG: DUF4337 family protein [Proteobacteria bacterium]|nr:DUF4337 family protein [Pseudomonadota bacterium]